MSEIQLFNCFQRLKLSRSGILLWEQFCVKMEQEGGSTGPLSTDNQNSPKTKAKVTKTKAQKKTAFLTDEEKKRHHIESEHKRRQAIRDAFNRLVELVPELKPTDNRSEILILNKSADYMDALYRENQLLVEQLEQKGVQVEDRLRLKNEI